MQVHLVVNLKSNMDRFIVETATEDLNIELHLKSNMDRFIEKLTMFSVQV